MTGIWTAPRGLHVALASPGDADQMARLHAAAFYRGWPRADFEAYAGDLKRHPAYVASDRNRTLAGFAIYKVVDAEAELLTIVVEGKWRGKGVGAALLRASLDDLYHSPVRTVFLEVEAGNTAAERLYRAFGFVEIARRSGYYAKPDGSAATALVMRCDLG